MLDHKQVFVLLDEFEEKTMRLLHRIEVLKSDYASLKVLNKELQEENQILKKSNLTAEKKLEAKLTADSIMGSSENKLFAKQKLDKIIKDVQDCIVKLS